jgi:putative inorganic carbon (HCO3(-)) transporter
MPFALQRLIAGVAAAELPIVLLISPALLFPTPARLLLLVLVPLTWACHWYRGDRIIPLTPLNVSLFMLVAMTGVSLFATFDVALSLGKVSGVLLGVLLFWAIARWTTTRERLNLLTAAFVVAGAGLAIVGLLGTNWMTKFPPFAIAIDRLPRVIRGLRGAEEGFQPNAVAGCLLLFVPMQVALLTAGAKKWLFVVQTLLLVLTTGTLLLTQSRGAWVGLIAASIAFCAWQGWRTRVLAAVAVAAMIAAGSFLGSARLLDLAISGSGTGMAANVSGRVELWSRALYGIQDFPLTGMGMNVFRKVLPVLYPTFLTSPDFDVAHAHNHLLQAGLDLGIPGLIAYLSIWLVVTVLLVRVYRDSRTPIDRVMAGGLGAGLIAHFVFSMTDAIPLGAKAGVLFWVTLGLVVSLHRVALPRETR